VELTLVIMQIVALGCLSALSVYLITVLIRVRGILTEVEHDFKEMSSKAIPVFENLEVITNKVRNVSENIDEQVEMVKSSILSVKEIVDSIVDFERRVQNRIEEPVLETVSVLAALFKGVRTFVDRIRG
jgi:uncharacterized protein YoxC